MKIALIPFKKERIPLAGEFLTKRHQLDRGARLEPPARVEDANVAAKAAEALLAKKTASGFVAYRDENLIAYLIGDQLPGADRTFMSPKKYLRPFENDSGMTMLRIGSMNLMLHGIESPQFFYMDTLSKSFNDEREYDVILMNPPFKGAVDKGDVHPSLPRRRRWNSSGSIHCLALFAGSITENLAGSNPFLLIPS